MTVTPLGISGELMASLCHWLTQLSVLGSSPAGQWILGFCPSWACSSLCRCSRHSANFTWPRDLAIPKGSLPRESGIEMALRSHLYSTTAASKCPRAHAHIWENRETERASSTWVKKKKSYLTSATAANWKIGPWQQSQRCHKTFLLQSGSDICHVSTRMNTKGARHIPMPAQKNSLGNKWTHFLPEGYRRSGPRSRGRPPVPSQCCLHALCWNRQHHKLLHRESMLTKYRNIMKPTEMKPKWAANIADGKKQSPGFPRWFGCSVLPGARRKWKVQSLL